MSTSNKFNIFLIVAIIILCYILFLTKCHKNTTDSQGVKTVTEQKIVVVKDTLELKRITDSLIFINNKQQLVSSSQIKELKQLQSKAKEIEYKLVTDTIYTSALTDYIDNSNQRDTTCNLIINNLKGQLSNRNALIKQNAISYKKQLANLDTCFAQQNKLEKIVNETKLRNQVYVGVSANVYPVLGYGIDLGIKLKNGLIIEGRAMQLNSSTYGQIALKKVISFRN